MVKAEAALEAGFECAISGSSPDDLLIQARAFLGELATSDARDTARLHDAIMAILSLDGGPEFVALLIDQCDALSLTRLIAIMQRVCVDPECTTWTPLSIDAFPDAVIQALARALGEISSDRAAAALSMFRYPYHDESAGHLIEDVAVEVIRQAAFVEPRTVREALMATVKMSFSVEPGTELEAHILRLAADHGTERGKVALGSIGAVDPAKAAPVIESVMQGGDDVAVLTVISSMWQRYKRREIPEPYEGELAQQLIGRMDRLSDDGKRMIRDYLLSLGRDMSDRAQGVALLRAFGESYPDSDDRHWILDHALRLAEGEDRAELKREYAQRFAPRVLPPGIKER